MEWNTAVIKALDEAVWDEKKPDVRLDDGQTCDIDTLDAFEYSIEEFMNKLIDNFKEERCIEFRAFIFALLISIR